MALYQYDFELVIRFHHEVQFDSEPGLPAEITVPDIIYTDPAVQLLIRVHSDCRLPCLVPCDARMGNRISAAADYYTNDVPACHRHDSGLCDGVCKGY